MESDIVSGQQSAWVLLKKLGEGDAGEVYLVESLLEKQPAILKRPVRSAFASDVIRQTTQITTEGKIIRAIDSALRMDGDFSACVPELLDQSRPGTAYSERLFIIIEKARGFDLVSLARAAHMGMHAVTAPIDTREERAFLQTVAHRGQMPARVLLSVLSALLGLFEHIHHRHMDVDGVETHGILWNDVKPEHLYWDPWRAQLTIIDWGNAQFLDRDGATRDRRYSASDDYRQFTDEMGRYLQMSAPELLAQLEWPRNDRMPVAHGQPELLEDFQHLRARIWELLQEQLFGLQQARQQESELLRHGAADWASGGPLTELESLHRRIIGYGELPDYAGALDLAMTCARQYAQAYRFAEVEETCEWAAELPGSEPDQLSLAAELARITSRSQTASEEQRACLQESVQAALQGEWPAVLWDLVTTLGSGPEPEWWFDLITAVRKQQLGPEAGEMLPLLAARRTLLTLQSMLEKMERKADETAQAALFRLEPLARRLREEVIPNWLHMDPGPPFGSLTYDEIEQELPEIGAFLPEAQYALEQVLARPRAQVRRVLEAWERCDFEGAAAGLRQALLWDPDRKRLLRANHALAAAPQWRARLFEGPPPGQHYQAFVTDMEFDGRELRNQVGPASWLDRLLEGCRLLRRGTWPPDLFCAMPELLKDMPWLRRFERVERLPASAREPAAEGHSDAHPNASGPAFLMLNTSARGKLGIEQEMHFHAPLDYWVPEARGSSARVYSGTLRDAQNQTVPAALKLMRMDKVEYALPLFQEEVRVLNAMRPVPGVTPMFECGFLKFDNGKPMPVERDGMVDPGLTGALVRVGPSIGQEFIHQIEARIHDGWTPYLALEQRDPQDNLMGICDAGMTAGQYRPVGELLLISIQICELLQEAHARNIVYRDHKILHYYWLEAMHGVFMIDWNVARLHPEGLSEYEKKLDLVQFGARALHHILTGRTAPGALPLGPTRPEEIEQAAKTYQTQWTYDDQRLPEDVRGILERVLTGEYNNAIQLRDDLKRAFLALPDV